MVSDYNDENNKIIIIIMIIINLEIVSYNNTQNWVQVHNSI